jgi:transaldolase/glucose-6-phosphate isomerase
MTLATIHRVLHRRCGEMSVLNLPDLEAALADWQTDRKTERLWNRDATLWTGQDEARWLGWLNVGESRREEVAALQRFAGEVRAAGFEHALLLGMGGSSLCADVLVSVYGKTVGFPRLRVLDSIDPRQVRRFASQIDPRRTLFIASSKSGTTLETLLLTEFFLGELKKQVGKDAVGAHFAVVTDPGTPLQELAQKEGFRWVFPGIPSIGGRFSALSNFGLVPAAVIGLDVKTLLRNAAKMVTACRSDVPAQENPGVVLGLALSVAARLHRDKVTLVASPGLGRLDLWIEQLLAESTGKSGQGLIPACGEPLGAPGDYGNDRLFCYLRDRYAPDRAQDESMARLEAAGFPVVRIEIADIDNLGQEFFRWEFATAVAGSALGINPFNQPDVEAAKIAAQTLLTERSREAASFPEVPRVQVDGVEMFDLRGDASNLAPEADAEALRTALRLHLEQLQPGDFFAVLAFVEMNDIHERILQGLRTTVRNALHVATLGGFGPRYLHSTGQLFKGGPNNGLFLHITSEDAEDVPVPGREFTLGEVKNAQAHGDLRVMTQRNRRLLHVHIGPDVTTGLGRLASETLAVAQSLSKTSVIARERTSYDA